MTSQFETKALYQTEIYAEKVEASSSEKNAKDSA